MKGLDRVVKYKIELIILILIIALVLTVNGDNALADDSLFVYCGAGLKEPMKEIGEKFEAEYGIKVDYQFNGSGALFNQITTVKTGDLYMPGDVWFIEKLKQVDKRGEEINYVYQQALVAYHTPVVVTPADNPARIKEFNDLNRSDLKAVFGDESIAIGRLTDKILAKANIPLKAVTKMGTVNQVVLVISLGQGDLGIVWRANYNEFSDKLKLIEIPQEFNIIKELSIAVLQSSEQKRKAVQFMNFVASDQGRDIFAEYGYKVKDKD